MNITNLDLLVHVKISKKPTEILSYEGNLLILRLQSKPVENQANDVLLNFLKSFFKAKKAEIRSGFKHKNKCVRISFF